MGFGKLLEKKMKEKNIKQSELAKAVGIPKTTLSSIISRDNNKVEIEKFLSICKYLNCDPEEFYSEYIQEKEKPPHFIDNKWEDLRIQLSSLSDNELIELHNYVKYLFWKRNSNEEQD